MHDWFNAKSASLLVEASQARVSRQSLTMDNEPDSDSQPRERADTNGAHDGVDRFADDESALHDAEVMQSAANTVEPVDVDDDDVAVMETFATQTQTIQQERLDDEGDESMADIEDDEETLREMTSEAPPVFRPLVVSLVEDLFASVQRRLKKGYEAFLEEQPKWSLLAKVLKEIEDTIARVTESHTGSFTDSPFITRNMVSNAWLADAPGANIVLIMASSDRTCLQLRQYLTTMEKTEPPFSASAGRKMMQTLFLSNWQHEKNGERLSNPARMQQLQGGDEVRVRKGEMEEKRMRDASRRGRGTPAYKRRRLRGGQQPRMRRNASEEEL